MRRTKILGSLAAAGSAGTGGCTVGPDYHATPPRVPAAWISPSPGGLTGAAAATSNWWVLFDDAELNSLVLRAVRSNPDLRVAEARLRQARAVRQLSAANSWPTLDASASAARAKSLGAQVVMEPFDVPTVGRIAVLVDPQGAAIGLFKPKL